MNMLINKVVYKRRQALKYLSRTTGFAVHRFFLKSALELGSWRHSIRACDLVRNLSLAAWREKPKLPDPVEVMLKNELTAPQILIAEEHVLTDTRKFFHFCGRHKLLFNNTYPTFFHFQFSHGRCAIPPVK
jgi:hypothetical protein